MASILNVNILYVIWRNYPINLTKYPINILLSIIILLTFLVPFTLILKEGILFLSITWTWSTNSV